MTTELFDVEEQQVNVVVVDVEVDLLADERFQVLTSASRALSTHGSLGPVADPMAGVRRTNRDGIAFTYFPDSAL